MTLNICIKYSITILLSIILCFFKASATENNLSLNNNIHNILIESRIKYKLPAISVSAKLPNRDKIYNYVDGYDTDSSKKNITPETLFQMGSITKTFTATIIYKLIDEKKITVNDHLAVWLPNYPRWNNITIYQLLHHTSGIYNYTHDKTFDNLLNKFPQKYWTLNELAELAYQRADLYPPGKKYNYTNTDYILLGLIIEKITHQPVQQVFNNYFKKYKLENIFYYTYQFPSIITNRIAHGYNRDGTFKFNDDVTLVSLSFNQSAGALIATPNDVIKWLIYLFDGKIITKKSLNDMLQVISEKNLKIINLENLSKKQLNETRNKPFTEIGIGAGIGLVYLKNNGLTWVHAGGTPGYEAFYAYNPCNGIYLALAYNIKPKQQLIFIDIIDKIFKQLNHSPEVIKAIRYYKKNSLLPAYCKHTQNEP